MDRRSEKRNYLLLVCAVIAIQIPDFIITPPVSPYWWLYLFNSFIDFSAFLVIYYFFYQRYSVLIFALLFLQSASVAVHLGGFLAESAYNIIDAPIFAQLCNMYSTCLQAILGLKMGVLGLGGYGVFRRRRVKHPSWDTHASVVLSSDHIANRNNQTEN